MDQRITHTTKPLCHVLLATQWTQEVHSQLFSVSKLEHTCNLTIRANKRFIFSIGHWGARRTEYSRQMRWGSSSENRAAFLLLLTQCESQEWLGWHQRWLDLTGTNHIREVCRIEFNLKFQPETSASSLRLERPPSLSRTYCLRSQSIFTMPGNPQPLTFINFPTYRQKLLHDIQKTHGVMSFDPAKLELVLHYWYVTIPLHCFGFKLFLQARQWAQAHATISIATIS